MKKLIQPLTLLFIVISCEMPASKESASVNQVSGLYVFVYCSPQSSFQELGSVNSDFAGQMKDATDKNKKIGQRIMGALATTAENVDFNSKMKIMIQKVKEQYPEANGIIFENAMDRAKAIRFE